VDLETMTLESWSGQDERVKEIYNFQLGQFNKNLVLEGGLVGFIAKKY